MAILPITEKTIIQNPPSEKKRKTASSPTDEVVKRFQEECAKSKIRSPLRNKVGRLLNGTYKEIRRTDNPDRVAFFTESLKHAQREMEILGLVAGGPHLPVLHAAFSMPKKQHVMIQKRFPPDLYETFLNDDHSLREPLSMVEMKKICKHLLEALSYMHQKGILHGDIKPNNCSSDGDLFDFSISEILGDGLTDNLKYILPYRPPETSLELGTQLSADIWALACMFFELFCKTRFADFNVKAPVESDQNMINLQHVYRQRLRVEIVGKGFYANYPDLCEGDEKSGYRLKPPTFAPLKPWQEEVLSHGQGDEVNQFVNLLEGMFKMNPKDRVTAEQALRHPFFTG
jgi:serine/threonine protein kinase